MASCKPIANALKFNDLKNLKMQEIFALFL